MTFFPTQICDFFSMTFFSCDFFSYILFSIAKGRANSKVLTSSLSPGDGFYSRELKAEKSQSLPLPVGWGAVGTNDWCINKQLGH